MAKTEIEAPLVDSHAHIFTSDMPIVSTAWNRPDFEYTAEDYLHTLDEHGVHFGVIAGISLFGTYNDYMLAMLAKYKRLRGTANVTPSTSWLELRDMADAGVVGIRVFREPNTFGEAPDIFNDDYQRLLRRVRDLNWHVHFIAGGDLFGETLDALNKSGVRVVADHFARCDQKAGLDCIRLSATLKAMEKGNTWLKISAGFRFAAKPGPGVEPDYDEAAETENRLVSAIIDRVGCDRLLWGSDAPFMGRTESVKYGRVLQNFATAVPNVQHRRAISDAAMKFYFY